LLRCDWSVRGACTVDPCIFAASVVCTSPVACLFARVGVLPEDEQGPARPCVRCCVLVSNWSLPCVTLLALHRACCNVAYVLLRDACRTCVYQRVPYGAAPLSRVLACCHGERGSAVHACRQLRLQLHCSTLQLQLGLQHNQPVHAVNCSATASVLLFGAACAAVGWPILADMHRRG